MDRPQASTIALHEGGHPIQTWVLKGNYGWVCKGGGRPIKSFIGIDPRHSQVSCSLLLKCPQKYQNRHTLDAIYDWNVPNRISYPAMSIIRSPHPLLSTDRSLLLHPLKPMRFSGLGWGRGQIQSPEEVAFRNDCTISSGVQGPACARGQHTWNFWLDVPTTTPPIVVFQNYVLRCSLSYTFMMVTRSHRPLRATPSLHATDIRNFQGGGNWQIWWSLHLLLNRAFYLGK